MLRGRLRVGLWCIVAVGVILPLSVWIFNGEGKATSFYYSLPLITPATLTPKTPSNHSSSQQGQSHYLPCSVLRWEVSSPDGRLKATVLLHNNSIPLINGPPDVSSKAEGLYYQLQREGVVVVPWSRLGVIAASKGRRTEEAESKKNPKKNFDAQQQSISVDPLQASLRRKKHLADREDERLLRAGSYKIEGGRGSFLDGMQCLRVRIVEGVREHYSLLHGKRRSFLDHHNSLHTLLQSESESESESEKGEEMELHMRVYNDGIAIAYSFPRFNRRYLIVEGEVTGFDMSKADRVWIQRHGGRNSGYEAEFYEEIPLPMSVHDNSKGYNLPALFRMREDLYKDTHLRQQEGLYVMLTEAGVTNHYCGTRLGVTSDGKYFEVRFPMADEGPGRDYVLNTNPFQTSWHLLIIGELWQIVESGMVWDVSEGVKEGILGNSSSSVGWIGGGKATIPLYSQPLSVSASATTTSLRLYREYIDSAAEFGWKFVVVGPEWVGWVSSSRQVRSLSLYAIMQEGSLGVWISLPVSAIVSPANHSIGKPTTYHHSYLQKISSWGVAGIIVDGWEGDKQDVMESYLDVLETAAEFELMVAFTGSTIPRGWNRKYPNLLTMQGFRGMTSNNNDTRGRIPSAKDNVVYGVSRGVLGGMSLPLPSLLFPNASSAIYSYGHTLALLIVLESPLVVGVGRADAHEGRGYKKFFAEFPFVKEFLRGLPTTWDDTVLLSGDPSSHVIIARRFDSDWWIGGITSDDFELTDWKFSLNRLLTRRGQGSPNSGGYEYGLGYGHRYSYRMIGSPASHQGDSLVETTGTLSYNATTMTTTSTTKEEEGMMRLSMRQRDGFVIHIHREERITLGLENMKGEREKENNDELGGKGEKPQKTDKLEEKEKVSSGWTALPLFTIMGVAVIGGVLACRRRSSSAVPP